MKSFLLGYDFRNHIDQGDPNVWPQGRRISYLLRPDVVAPVSVDTQVLPSKLEVDTEDRMFLLYSRLDDLLAALKRNDLSVAEGTIIAVGVLLDEDYLPSKTTVDALLENDEKDKVLPLDSQKLGFDVGDRFFLSGLMNTGLGAEQLNKLRPYWSERINKYGLFSSDVDAGEFKAFLDTAVREHAPFFIYGLHLVKLVNPEK